MYVPQGSRSWLVIQRVSLGICIIVAQCQNWYDFVHCRPHLFKRGSFSMKINELMFSDGGAKPIFSKTNKVGSMPDFLRSTKISPQKFYVFKKCFYYYMTYR